MGYSTEGGGGQRISHFPRRRKEGSKDKKIQVGTNDIRKISPGRLADSLYFSIQNREGGENSNNRTMRWMSFLYFYK